MPPWQFKNVEEARNLISSEPIGAASIDFQPIELGLAPNLSFPGANRTLAINPRGKFTIAVLNDATDLDEDEIIAATKAEIADGTLEPQLLFDDRAWLKLRAEAGVKATASTTVAEVLGLEGEAGLGIAVADYRLHARTQPTREAFLADIADARFVTNHDDVEKLQPGEAVALRRPGTIQATVTLQLSDVFAGQIGTLSRLFEIDGAVALSIKTGVTITAEVRVSDEFVIAISRISANTWRAGLRKARSTRIAPSVDAGISVGFADEKAVEKLLTGVVDSVLNAPLVQVKALLQKASLEALNPVERRLAMLVIERLGLDPVITTLEALGKRVDEIEKKALDVIKDVAKARIALSFAYEYVRVQDKVNLLQVTLDQPMLRRFHSDLVRGRTLPITESLVNKDPGVVLESYFNQKSVISEHSWGFTLGIGKWVKIGGKDFTRLRRIQRFDLDSRVQESYLGARGYKGSWIGETFEWVVDLKADMKSYAIEPRVSDFSFGLHLAWFATQKKLSATELEEWLDAALIWRVVNEASIPEIRGRMANAIGRDAELELHITIPNTVFRSVIPLFAKMPVEDYAVGLATSMPWMKDSRARSDAARRRVVYEPLWRIALGGQERSPRDLARVAEERLRRENHPEIVLRETMQPHSPDPFTFVGLATINGDVRRTCTAFSRGAQILQIAIDNGARNQGTIDKAVGLMNDLWAQSHHVRAIGVQLLDLADSANQVAEVSRTMNLRAKGVADELVVIA